RRRREACCCFVSRRLAKCFPRSKTLLPAFNPEILANPGGVLPENVVILAERMALPLVGKQDALQIRVAGKNDAEHIENFALEPISRWPNLGQACGALTVRDGNFQAQAPVMRERIKN